MFEVAAILINYNSSAYTVKCIDSILEKTAENLHYQITVVDNASETPDYLFLKNYCATLGFKNLQLVRSSINMGFGGGNMLGVKHSNAEFYAFVNNDTVFLNDCLSILKNSMETHPEFGICGPTAYKENGEILPTLDHFASPVKEIFGRKFLETINPKEYPNRKKEYTSPQIGQFVSGSFMMVRAVDFHEVGGFDTNIFLYYEETDLCRRLRKINKFAYQIPDARFVHHHGGSTEKSIAIKTELKISLLYVVKKHNGILAFYILLTWLQLRYFFSSIFKPKYRSLFHTLLLQAPLSRSLKYKQTVKPLS